MTVSLTPADNLTSQELKNRDKCFFIKKNFPLRMREMQQAAMDEIEMRLMTGEQVLLKLNKDESASLYSVGDLLDIAVTETALNTCICEYFTVLNEELDEEQLDKKEKE